MADRMGLSQASYSRLEGGKSAFSVDQMFQAASALGLSGDELNRQLNATIMHLETNGVTVVPQLRSSSTQAKDEAAGLGHLIVGAALGALLIGLLSKK